MTLAAGKTCFIDMGHHTLFGHVLSALKGELGARMTTVRLRRSRLDTAMSYAIKRKKDGPCGSRCVVMIEHLSAFYLTLVTEGTCASIALVQTSSEHAYQSTWLCGEN
jgi:hypothetical protein